jgi:hypothetical protein
MVLNPKILWPGRIVSGAIVGYCAYLFYHNRFTIGQYFLYVTSGITIVIGIEMIITLALREIEIRRWNNLHRRFELVFGWSMSANRDYIQAAVDEELTRRARRLWGVCEQQARLVDKLATDDDILDECDHLSGVIKDLKRIFWDAHALAAEARFSVRRSFKDYFRAPGIKT